MRALLDRELPIPREHGKREEVGQAARNRVLAVACMAWLGHHNKDEVRMRRQGPRALAE